MRPSEDSSEVAWRTLDLDVFEFSAQEHVYLAMHIMNALNIPAALNISHHPEPLRQFISQALDMYGDVPFHNRFHAWSVFHVTALLLDEARASALLEPNEQAGALLAALTHDLEHDGVNNAFEIGTCTPRAKRHGMGSKGGILELHHNQLAQQLLTDTQLLEQLTDTSAERVRECVRASIRGTDMCNHFEHVEFLSQLRDTLRWFARAPIDRVALVASLVHASDLSGQALCEELAAVWGDRCLQEFKAQAELEALLNLDVSMDGRDMPSKRASMQHNFCTNIVRPLYELLADIFPWVQPMLNSLNLSLIHI
eukprot:TRINITY_DN44767_c0_g1_i1.p1 TRINITY_DN44767_c0_g1~~TRINITY_DN44767_c0_g1_i1.p1  ORF type:complete len:311 (+),score=78.66 TRINITY_DN44767_c0_g1_i1:42-974(+)